MNNPTPKQFKRVISNIDRILPMTQHEGHLDMGECTVKDFNHPCNTTHCLGGWYTHACSGEIPKMQDDFLYVGYEFGANLMAKHLGFEHAYYLKEWADINPDDWGNEDGFCLFSHEAAFDWAIPMTEIRNFLAKVHNRLCKKGGVKLDDYVVEVVT